MFYYVVVVVVQMNGCKFVIKCLSGLFMAQVHKCVIEGGGGGGVKKALICLTPFMKDPLT